MDQCQVSFASSYLITINSIHKATTKEIDSELDVEIRKKYQGTNWKFHTDYIQQQASRILSCANLYPGNLSPLILILKSTKYIKYFRDRLTTYQVGNF